MSASFTRSLQTCLGQRRKACVSRVADENTDFSTHASGENNHRKNGGVIWSVLKAPLHALACLGNGYANSAFEEEDEGERSLEPVNRNSEQRIWFAKEPSLAEKNYLLVRSSMRYAISM